MATFVGKEPGMQVTEAQWKSFGGDLPMLRFKGSSFENHNILDIMFSAQPQLQGKKKRKIRTEMGTESKEGPN